MPAAGACGVRDDPPGGPPGAPDLRPDPRRSHRPSDPVPKNSSSAPPTPGPDLGRRGELPGIRRTFVAARRALRGRPGVSGAATTLIVRLVRSRARRCGLLVPVVDRLVGTTTLPVDDAGLGRRPGPRGRRAPARGLSRGRPRLRSRRPSPRGSGGRAGGLRRPLSATAPVAAAGPDRCVVQPTSVTRGFPTSTRYVDSMRPVPGPRSRALWGVSGGMRNPSPACSVRGGRPSTSISTVPAAM